MDPDQFYIIARQLPQLNSQDISDEIKWRTIANRVYYYLYHVARKDLTEKLSQDPFLIPRDTLEGKFSYHKKVINFYELASTILENKGQQEKADLAEENKDILDLYRIIREAADYNIGGSYQIVESREIFGLRTPSNINFNSPSDTWSSLLTNSPQTAAETLIDNNNKIKEGLESVSNKIKKMIRKL